MRDQKDLKSMRKGVNWFDCSRYVFWFHIISQSGNAVLASQSEEVAIVGCGQVVDIPD